MKKKNTVDVLNSRIANLQTENARMHKNIKAALTYLDLIQEEEMTIKNWDAMVNAYSWLEEALGGKE